MIRSEISHSPAPLPSKSFEKKSDVQDDFNLLLQMFTQPVVVESGFDAAVEQQEVELKSLPLVETAEIFSRVFTLKSDESAGVQVDIKHQHQPQPVKEVVVTLPELADRKSTILNGFLPVTVSIGEAKKMTAITPDILTLADESGGEQQVVEWGSLSTGYLSYLAAVVSGYVHPIFFMVQPANEQLRAGISDFTQAFWSRSLPVTVTDVGSDSLQSAEYQYTESIQVFEAFDLEHSANTERMASAWYASDISREYLNVLHDERGGVRVYYRNYFESDQKQAATMLFDLVTSDAYSNVIDAKINGQTVQRGEKHGR